MFVGDEPPFSVDLAVYLRSRNVRHELRNLNKLADPMVYLFPRGEKEGSRILPQEDQSAKRIIDHTSWRQAVPTIPSGRLVSYRIQRALVVRPKLEQAPETSRQQTLRICYEREPGTRD